VSKRERVESESKDEKKRRTEGSLRESVPMSWSCLMFAKGFESSSVRAEFSILGEFRRMVRLRERSVEQD